LWLLALIVTVAVYRPAFAYLDPGTGSILLQVLLGGVAGGLVVVKLYWSRVKLYWSRFKAFFGREPKEAATGGGNAQGDDETLST
jgi:hypothetical protein